MKNCYIAKVLLVITCFLTIYSCQKEKNAKDYYWIQTKCADPWKTGENNSDSEIEASVIDYLKNENVEVFDISIKNEQDLIDYCKACSCKNGKRIIVTVDNEKKLESLGFKKY